MPCVTRRLPVALLVCLTAILAGCASPKPAFEREDFTQNDVFSRTFPTASTTACDAGRRALLSQGYNIDRFDPARVSGHKNFQGEDGLHTQINFNIDCASDGSANQRATVFANAVQDRYSIKRTTSSASVGVSVLGQVSMPFGSSDDSLVKTASQTVSRPKFYEGFFQLLQRFLPDAEAAAAPHVPPPSRARGSQAKPAAPPADPVVSPDAPADTLNPAAANGPSGPGAVPDKAVNSGADKPAGDTPHPTPPSTPGNTETGTTPAVPATSGSAAPTTPPASASAAASATTPASASTAASSTTSAASTATTSSTTAAAPSASTSAASPATSPATTTPDTPATGR
ncbi:DUF2242 domain-containing protein [Achromobacter piechaudii]|uniref:DUF2242 domain-containing protein n=1 Tax=Achromobacter piechaudii ATCC 43553 TaxID=742159 RepID=D4XFQ6_9BURK|nr:DUF2242 domain-containing protein [Achromobacter piechaudii]EFF74348.1 hypothetical protein HMPREF0004_4303 [Achromobacter piechaudii ATCC 43553]